MDASHSNEINELTKRFVAHQRALGLSDARFAGRYERFLGSHKTWLKLKCGDWAGHVNESRILDKLKKFAEQIDGARTFDSEQFYRTLPYVQQMNAQLERLLASPLDIRGLVALGPQGLGKSWWASDVMAQNAKEEQSAKYFYLRLLASHRERSYQIARAIMEKLGGTCPPNPGDIMPALIAHAKALGEFVIIFDEAHNGGIALFKVLKDLIDETAMRFVYLGFPTEFDVIVGSNRSAIGESRQTLRRCLQPICDEFRDGVMVADVEAYLAGQGFPRNGELRKVAAEIQPLITVRYNLTTLATAVREARKQAEDQDVKLTLGMVNSALQAQCATAASRRAMLQAMADAQWERK